MELRIFSLIHVSHLWNFFPPRGALSVTLSNKSELFAQWKHLNSVPVEKHCPTKSAFERFTNAHLYGSHEANNIDALL